MIQAGVPVIPGSTAPVYQVKGRAGSSGKSRIPGDDQSGARRRWKRDACIQFAGRVRALFPHRSKEAQMAFGDGTMYLEHFVRHPRHIEFQILADTFGNVIHLGERDCSVQRNHQKLIEESPCTAISPKLRKAMGRAAVKAAKAVGYTNAGTVEFLLGRKAKKFLLHGNEYAYTS